VTANSSPFLPEKWGTIPFSPKSGGTGIPCTPVNYAYARDDKMTSAVVELSAKYLVSDLSTKMLVDQMSIRFCPSSLSDIVVSYALAALCFMLQSAYLPSFHLSRRLFKRLSAAATTNKR